MGRRPRPIYFTPGRPYKKNDQATIANHLIGYLRFEDAR